MFEKYDLNYKVDQFIKAHEAQLRKADALTDIGQYHKPRELRDHIEAKAVYSELRWPAAYYDHFGKKTSLNEEFKAKFTWDLFNIARPLGAKHFGMEEKQLDQNVLYRIIERGGIRTGPRRGVWFAEEFDLDINIPVSYSIDFSDPKLFEFLTSQLTSLNPNTVCPVDYFCRNSDKLKNVHEETLGDVVGELYKSKAFRPGAVAK